MNHMKSGPNFSTVENVFKKLKLSVIEEGFSSFKCLLC